MEQISDLAGEMWISLEIHTRVSEGSRPRGDWVALIWVNNPRQTVEGWGPAVGDKWSTLLMAGSQLQHLPPPPPVTPSKATEDFHQDMHSAFTNLDLWRIHPEPLHTPAGPCTPPGPNWLFPPWSCVGKPLQAGPPAAGLRLTGHV